MVCKSDWERGNHALLLLYSSQRVVLSGGWHAARDIDLRLLTGPTFKSNEALGKTEQEYDEVCR